MPETLPDEQGSASLRLLPIALDVRGRACLVVGGGPVGARKAASLLECGASVTLIAPELCEAARAQLARCEHWPREWRSGDGAGFSLIWACTPSRTVNESIAREARACGAWCGVSGAGSDGDSAGDVHGAAAVRRGEICVGISTGGASPALSRHLKARVEAAIGDEYETLLRWMSEERPILKARVESQGARADVWRQVLASSVLDLLRAGREEEARAAFRAITRGED